MLILFFVGYSTLLTVTFSYVFPEIDTPLEIQKKAVQGLIIRLIGPDKSSPFLIEIRPKEYHQPTDSFTLVKLNHNIQITATSGVAAAYGFNFYLKNFCNCHISWDNDQLNLPSELPSVNITIVSPNRFRYYQNVCTYSYSYVWWTWKRWEREIDWMSLNGINIALAFTAQEVIWSRVYRTFNLTDKDINDHFTGPAFLAWGRMANIRGWGGPLFKGWYQDQLSLQHKILERMKNLGIIPVLPAFCGHVPQAFRRIFPNAKMSSLSAWGNFSAQYCCPYLLEPDEILFEQIGELYYDYMKSEFGISHFYNCDLFNELKPPHSNLTYLKNIASKVLNVLLEADPFAVWIMQGWLFGSDAKFWTAERVQHFLSGVPNNKMIILDLQSEIRPMYMALNFYFGKPFIWCMLHNFGGTLGMHGSLDVLNNRVIEARELRNSTMVGTGMTPEGINQNYVVYDFMSEISWRNTPVNTSEWVEKYSERRYGSPDAKLKNTWKLLLGSVYNYKLLYPLHGQYTLILRPSTRHVPWTWYEICDIVTAWNFMLSVNEELHKNANYRHDLTDLTRQVFQILFDHFYKEVIHSYNEKNSTSLQINSKLLLDSLLDLDFILATNGRFMVGPWIQNAIKKGHTKEEKKMLEKNARYQITLWGPNGEELDYAGKQWSGLIEDYYHPRWKLFTESLYQSLVHRIPFDQHIFNRDVFTLVEHPFSNSQKKYPYNPLNDTYYVVKNLYLKWKSYLKLE